MFKGFCGWHDESNGMYQWERHQGATPALLTGPTIDHTTNSSAGWYVFVDSGQGSGKETAINCDLTIFELLLLSDAEFFTDISHVVSCTHLLFTAKIDANLHEQA